MKNRLLPGLLVGALAAVVGSTALANNQGVDVKVGAKPAGKPGVTAEQRTLLAEKLAIVDKLMRAAGAHEVGPNIAPDRQRWMLESLYKMSVVQLRAMRMQGSPDLLANEIAKSSKVMPKEGPAFGSTTTELTFLPIQPCRYIDTRNVGGPIVGSRQYDIDQPGNVHGGSAACDPITSTVGSFNSPLAAAIAANVAIVSPTAAPGFIGARPVGSTNTTALVNWYQAGASVQASNAGILAIDQQGAVVEEIEFFGSPTQIIVDVFGVFAAPAATALDCAWVQSTTPMPTINTYYTNTNTCGAGYTLTGGGCWFGSANNGRMVVHSPAIASIETTWFCGGRSDVANDTLYGYARCCRIPGR